MSRPNVVSEEHQRQLNISRMEFANNLLRRRRVHSLGEDWENQVAVDGVVGIDAERCCCALADVENSFDSFVWSSIDWTRLRVVS